MKMNIKATIEYRNNDEIWAMERIAKENGYKKTEDCYWTQLFENESGEIVCTVREENKDTSRCKEQFENAVKPSKTANDTDNAEHKGEKKSMLKTNSKEARANIKAYIIRNFDGESYTENPPTKWPEIAAFILATFREEKFHLLQDYRYYHGNESAAFADWAAGLPSVLDTCYYYNRSAVDDLGEILQENESEKAKYTEQQAESLLTSLIYRELLRGCKA